jgi:hypothetical protein
MNVKVIDGHPAAAVSEAGSCTGCEAGEGSRPVPGGPAGSGTSRPRQSGVFRPRGPTGALWTRGGAFLLAVAASGSTTVPPNARRRTRGRRGSSRGGGSARVLGPCPPRAAPSERPPSPATADGGRLCEKDRGYRRDELVGRRDNRLLVPRTRNTAAPRSSLEITSGERERERKGASTLAAAWTGPGTGAEKWATKATMTTRRQGVEAGRSDRDHAAKGGKEDQSRMPVLRNGPAPCVGGWLSSG